jgi:hypothetical protein
MDSFIFALLVYICIKEINCAFVVIAAAVAAVQERNMNNFALCFSNFQNKKRFLS